MLDVKKPPVWVAWSVQALIALTILTSPLVFWQGSLAFTVFENDIYQWLPRGFKEAQEYEWFKDRFGVDEMVVISWPGCEDTSTWRDADGDLVEPEITPLDRLAAELRVLRNERAELYFDRVTTGSEVLERLQRTPGLTEETAMARATGVFFGPDGKTTCCLAYPSAAGSRKRTETIDVALETATRITGLSPDEIHLGGPTVDGAAIDQESKNSLRRFMWMSVVLVMGLAWIRTRNPVLSAAILMCSLYCAFLGLTLLRLTGGTMNLTMVMLPTLTFILGVSASIHMTNYFIKAYIRTPELADASAVRFGGYPVAMAALTTSLGMGSLASSQILPIKSFGIYSAMAILASLPIILFMLPYALGVVARMFPKLVRGAKGSLKRKRYQSSTALILSRLTLRNHGLVTLSGIAIMVVLAIGVIWLEATLSIQNRFHSSTKIIRDYNWLEENLGPLVPMEIVLEIPNDLQRGEDLPFDHWDRGHLVSALEENIRASEFIQASYSAATFQPPSTSRTFEQQARKTGWRTRKRSLIENRLIAGRFYDPDVVDGVYSENAVLLDDPDKELWRISVRIKAMEKTDYNGLLVQISGVVDEFLELANGIYKSPSGEQMSAVITGGVPMMYKAQQQVLSDLVTSFLTAFVLISLVMVVLMRSIMAGLLAMIPNVFAPLVVFGSMGWMGMAIEIGSVMTASIALGIAVDDTIHFLAWYRRGIRENLRPRLAVIYAYQHCAKSMIDTTLICGLGTLPFVFSVFMPTVRFSILLAVLLGGSLLGALILLPSMLSGPLGRFFGRKRITAGGGTSPVYVPPPAYLKRLNIPQKQGQETSS